MRKKLLITSKPGKHRLWRISKWWDYDQHVQYKELPEKIQQLSNFYRIIKEEFQEFEREDQILGQ